MIKLLPEEDRKRAFDQLAKELVSAMKLEPVVLRPGQDLMEHYPHVIIVDSGECLVSAPRTAQKTWCDLLGKDTTDCLVDGRYIVRHGRLGVHNYEVLWSFESHEMAARCMETWVNECKGGTNA